MPPLDRSLLDPALVDGARVVVLLVIDGYSAVAHARHGARLARVGHETFQSATLTSVFPSSTAAALTSLQTGVGPGRHGMAGYTLYLPALGRVVNMVRFQPVDGGQFDAQTLDTASFLPVPSIYAILRDAGIESVVVSHRDYANSPLTQVHSGKTHYVGHRTPGEFAALLLREIVRPGRRFVFGYWAGVDMLGHTHGPAADASVAEIDTVLYALRQHVLEPLARLGGDVSIILTADHGLTDIPVADATSMNDINALTGAWRKPATGERRAVGLSLPEPGTRLRLVDALGERAAILDANEAIGAGLYGPGDQHPDLAERIGDTLLLSRGPASFPFVSSRPQQTPSLGAHGSLTPDEMLVPLLAWRFG
ncbi:MAG TPA: alkaline phosphatase family protein [Thermomicrobiales bacterium]|nr:alkaline phosphatase family protein [Thermomicrobiales bacterium]